VSRLKLLGALIGLGLAGAAIGVAGRRRSGLGEASIRYREYAPKAVEPEIDEAAERAVKAGAKGRLEFIGAGMTGIVFCDEAERAFKVSRRSMKRPEQDTRTVEDEAAWLRKASNIPGVREHVVRGVRYDDKHDVLVRECVRPSPARDRRMNDRKLRNLHERIGKTMRAYGWGSPEFKPDSYVYTRDRGPVLVDAGFAHRRGQELVQHVLDVLNNRRSWRWLEKPADLAWELRMERGESIPAPVANKLIQRLQKLDPTVEL
jgi:hypothetical protein